MNLGEDLLEFVGAQQIVELSAPRRYEKERTPQRDVEVLHQGDDLIDLADVPAAERGVDLHGKANLVGPADSIDGAGK